MGLHLAPRFNSVACTFGRYCSRELAVKTLVLVSLDTLQLPFTTRDTVAVETTASLATSVAVLDTAFLSVDAFTSMSLFDVAVRIPDFLAASMFECNCRVLASLILQNEL